MGLKLTKEQEKKIDQKVKRRVRYLNSKARLTKRERAELGRYKKLGVKLKPKSVVIGRIKQFGSGLLGRHPFVSKSNHKDRLIAQNKADEFRGRGWNARVTYDKRLVYPYTVWKSLKKQQSKRRPMKAKRKCKPIV